MQDHGRSCHALAEPAKPDDEDNAPASIGKLSVHGALQSMDGDEAPDLNDMSTFLEAKIEELNVVRDACATN